MISYAFGSTGPSVARIGQGSWNVPESGAEAEEAKRALRRGIELGLTHVDTAEMYGEGRAEDIIGDAIAGLPRERIFLVSKVLPSNASYQGTLRACERSLKRLRTEYLDCFLLHWPGSHPIAETMRAMEKLVDDGKIRALGVSNFDVEDLDEARAALERHPLACNQVLYHLNERGIEHRILPWCAQRGVALVGYTPFGRTPIPSASVPQGAAIDAAARAHGVSAHAVVLAFLTRNPGMFAIPKAASPAHVESNAAAGDLQLSDAEIAALEAAYPRPRSHQLKTL